MSMQPIGALLGKYRRPDLAKAVPRALLIEEANRWLAENLPMLARQAAAKAVVGRTLCLQCDTPVVACEARLAAFRLLKHLRGRFPGFPLDGLKCLVRGGNVG